MSQSLLELLVLILLVTVCLNLFLTLRIARIVREAPEPQELPFTHDIGQPAPAFRGTWLSSGAAFSSDDLRGHSIVAVFLSSGCGDCRKRLPEVVAMLPAMRRAGVRLLVIGMEGERKVRAFLGDTPLFAHAVMIDRSARRLLNPRNSSPFYLFIGDDHAVKASNFIGDKNWLVFADQMGEYHGEAQPEAVSAA